MNTITRRLNTVGSTSKKVYFKSAPGPLYGNTTATVVVDWLHPVMPETTICSTWMAPDFMGRSIPTTTA